MNPYIYEAIRYSLIVCRNLEGKFLVVKEKKGAGWWIPGGKLEPTETFLQAAMRQCKEESGIDPEIKGIIRVDYGKYRIHNSLRVVYYAEPKFPFQKPVAEENDHVMQASFKTLDQIIKLRWRSPEIFDFPHYLSKGGKIHPMSIFEENFNTR